MSSPAEIHRHPDGSIDFDHYRRDAARLRTVVLRSTSCRIAATLAQIAAAFIAKAPRKLSAPRHATR
jgi:hypothetical protein